MGCAIGDASLDWARPCCVNTSRSDEANVDVFATPVELFDYLDDQARLANHMKKRSTMIMGGSMTYEFDEASGRAVGSVIKLAGAFSGSDCLSKKSSPNNNGRHARIGKRVDNRAS
jgi:hypothetical protein